MNTTIYLIRHSEPFEIHRGITNTKESILIENQKSPLSIRGEKLAEIHAKNDEFKNLNEVWSSNYVRAMSTAKYFAHNNNLKVNIDENFNERIHGVELWSELPQDFELKQFNNENYKIGYGESQQEVRERMYKSLINIINKNKGKRIAIISHSTAIAYLLKTWCITKYKKEYKFNNKVFFDGNWNYLESFKLVFDENNNLIKIKNIKI